MTPDELLALANRYEMKGAKSGLMLTAKEINFFVSALRELAAFRVAKQQARTAKKAEKRS